MNNKWTEDPLRNMTSSTAPIKFLGWRSPTFKAQKSHHRRKKKNLLSLNNILLDLLKLENFEGSYILEQSDECVDCPIFWLGMEQDVVLLVIG